MNKLPSPPPPQPPPPRHIIPCALPPCHTAFLRTTLFQHSPSHWPRSPLRLPLRARPAPRPAFALTHLYFGGVTVRREEVVDVVVVVDLPQLCGNPRRERPWIVRVLCERVKERFWQKERKKDRKADRQKDRKADRQKGRKADRQKGRFKRSSV